jgi:hypothetical protein
MMKSLLVASLLLLAPLTVRAEDNQCHIATQGSSPVAQACKKGGREAAESEMKKLVKAAKVHGTSFKCTSCHTAMDDLTLKKSARDDFKKLLAAQ